MIRLDFFPLACLERLFLDIIIFFTPCLDQIGLHCYRTIIITTGTKEVQWAMCVTIISTSTPLFDLTTFLCEYKFTRAFWSISFSCESQHPDAIPRKRYYVSDYKIHIVVHYNCEALPLVRVYITWLF